MSVISGFYSLSHLPEAAMLPPVTAAALGKGAKAAREFEAQLIGTLLESLEKSFAAVPGQDAMAGGDDCNYPGTKALAWATVAGGSFRIARVISGRLGSTKVTPHAASRAAPRAPCGPSSHPS